MSFDLFNSPNLKIDLAANRNPIPSMLSVNMNVRIKILSRYPIHFPALGSPCNEGILGIHEWYSINDFMRIDEGLRIATYDVKIIHAVWEIFEINCESGMSDIM